MHWRLEGSWEGKGFGDYARGNGVPMVAEVYENFVIHDERMNESKTVLVGLLRISSEFEYMISL